MKSLKELKQEDFEKFLYYSMKDDECNKMWDKYRSQKITYEELESYEILLYKKMKRENTLNGLLNKK